MLFAIDDDCSICPKQILNPSASTDHLRNFCSCGKHGFMHSKYEENIKMYVYVRINVRGSFGKSVPNVPYISRINVFNAF